MAKITDILAVEETRSDATQQRTVHLFKDGNFYRAYEYSAWLCCRYVHPFQATKRDYKAVNKELVFIGFPLTSIDKFMPEGVQPTVEGDTARFEFPASMVQNITDYAADFKKWKDALPLAVPKPQQRAGSAQSAPSLANHPVSMTGVFKEVLAWDVMDHTPIESIQFLTAIQRKLAAIC